MSTKRRPAAAAASPDARPPMPEAATIAAVLAESAASSPAAWAALAGCRLIEVTTAGVAPEVSGAGAGAAVVAQGYARAGRRPPRPEAAACLSLTLSLAAVRPDPAARAALAGVALGLAVLQGLVALGWSSAPVTLWTDDRRIAGAPAAGMAHADLWAYVRQQQQALRWAVPGGVRIAWREASSAPGAAPALALEAAFAAAPTALARYRSLRDARPSQAAAAPPPRQPPLDTDYVLVLGDHPPVGMLAATPAYRLWARDGRSRQGYATAGARTGAGGEALAWTTLIAALEDVLARIAARRRPPGRFALTVYSSCEPLVAALRTGAAGAPSSRQQAQALLAQFGAATLVWQPAALIESWLADAERG